MYVIAPIISTKLNIEIIIPCPIPTQINVIIEKIIGIRKPNPYTTFPFVSSKEKLPKYTHPKETVEEIKPKINAAPIPKLWYFSPGLSSFVSSTNLFSILADTLLTSIGSSI